MNDIVSNEDQLHIHIYSSRAVQGYIRSLDLDAITTDHSTSFKIQVRLSKPLINVVRHPDQSVVSRLSIGGISTSHTHREKDSEARREEAQQRERTEMQRLTQSGSRPDL